MNDDDIVLVAEPAFERPPFAMAYHEVGPLHHEYGQMSSCFYVHDWVKVRRDVARSFARPCMTCAQRKAVIERSRLHRESRRTGVTV